MWAAVRRFGLQAQLLVGLKDGKLAAWEHGFFVEKDRATQARAAAPAAPTSSYTTLQPSPEEQAANERAHGVDLWSKRLAIGSFDGTPLEGRIFWPIGWRGNPEPKTVDGKDGWYVPILAFVTRDEVAAQIDAAGDRYDQAKRELAEAAEAKRIADEEAAVQLAARKAELLAMAPPAVVVVDGEAWARNEEGAYEPISDPNGGWLDDWPTLIAELDAAADGTVFDTREEFDARHAAAVDKLAGSA